MTDQSKAVAEFMESLGFVRDTLSPYGWLLPGTAPQMYVDHDAATFFYNICQQRELEAERRGEVAQLKLLKHWATQHDIAVTVDDLDHVLGSIEQLPNQPLARKNLEAIAQLTDKPKAK